MYEERTYRRRVKSDDLVDFQVAVKETDLFIGAERELREEAVRSTVKLRARIEEYVATDPAFEKALEPYHVNGNAPAIIRLMADASALAGVGPFASVAGAIAECVGKDLLEHSRQVVVENGGDIFIKSLKDRVIGIYAGSSAFNEKLSLKIRAEDTPLGICTSSGTVGHSLSFGRADAVTVLSGSTALADAAATSICNVVKNSADIPEGLKLARKINGVIGALIIKDDKMGAWGKIEIL